MKTRQDGYKEALKTAKRIAITMLCCIPVLVIFAYLTRKVITSNAVQILCFILIMGVVVLIEEIVYRKSQKKKEQNRKNTTDVFK